MSIIIDRKKRTEIENQEKILFSPPTIQRELCSTKKKSQQWTQIQSKIVRNTILTISLMEKYEEKIENLGKSPRIV